MKRQPGGLSRDHVLDHITLFWLTNTASEELRRVASLDP
jgi:hypothetical protein